MNVVRIDTIKDATIYVSTQRAEELLSSGQIKPQAAEDPGATDTVHELILGKENSDA